MHDFFTASKSTSRSVDKNSIRRFMIKDESMFAGIVNFFVIQKMFGQADIFSGSELSMLNIFWGDSRIALEIKTAHEMLFVPERWKRNQQGSPREIYVYLTLHCITAFEANFGIFGFSDHDPLRISSGKIEPGHSDNKIELIFENNQWLRIQYKIGRIQNTSNVPRNR